MDSIFGVPMETFMVAVAALLALCVAVMVVIGVRHRVAVRVGVRNLPRRRTQSVLIVFGLMLATLLFSVSFSTGDTLTNSFRDEALAGIGEIDVLVEGETAQGQGRLPYFSEAVKDEVSDALAEDPQVEGVAPAVRETVPVVAQESGLSEPSVAIVGLDPRQPAAFGTPMGADGTALSLADLGEGEILLSATAAERLEAGPGDQLLVFLGSTPVPVSVRAIFTEGVEPAGDVAIAADYRTVGAWAGQPGRITTVMVANQGDIEEAAAHGVDVAQRLDTVVGAASLNASAVRQDALDAAQATGASIGSVFLLFAQFSVAAGILLIFLIFVMLAAERRHELGIARAVGAQRGEVVRMFAFEGATYDLIAAAVGSVLGIFVGWGLAELLGVAFGQFDFALSFSFNWRSVVTAFALGVVFTFLIVVVSSWRVSRLNIVRAVRDIPEPHTPRRGRRGIIAIATGAILAALLLLAGLQSMQAGTLFLGVSVAIVVLALLARRLGLPERAAFTVAGLALIAFWLLPTGTWEGVLPDLDSGIDMFFISGMSLVLGGTWVVMYNADVVLWLVATTLGRIRGLTPVVKTAVAYPMEHRFRTGVTLAMFALVIFTIVIMAFITGALGGLFSNAETIAGGFHVRADVSAANPVEDFAGQLDEVAGLDREEITAVGATAGVQLVGRPDGSTMEPAGLYAVAADDQYGAATTYGLELMPAGVSDPAEVWRLLQSEPGTALVSPALVPSRVNYGLGNAPPPFVLEGFYLQDESLPDDVYITVALPAGGGEQKLRVVGVMNQLAVYTGQLVTSSATLTSIAGGPVPPQSYWLRLRDPARAEDVAKSLEKHFLTNGLQGTDLADEINRIAGANIMINRLLQWFMALGLVVGIAALGVIAARSVVERRQQIGVLRAIGFQRRMVLGAFLLESSFIALLGIALGVALALALGPQVVGEMAAQFGGLETETPWTQILITAGVAYLAALITTYVPAVQASRVYPAQALRYE
jgi:putative ABC transport system permease protein